MLISNFAYKNREKNLNLIFAIGPQIHQVALCSVVEAI